MPNLILSFIFSIIDTVVFLNLLFMFKKNRDNYRFTNITVLIVMSAIAFTLTLLGVIPYIKIIIISIILFLITFLYKMEFYERILLVALYYFIIIISELLVTLLISNVLNIDFETIESAYKYFFYLWV